MNLKINQKDIKYMVSECIKKILSEAQTLVDNFDMISKILDINSDDDFHFVQIMKRKKDNPNDDTRKGNYYGGTWYLGGFRVHNSEELMKLKPQIINICNKENARAYISINNRSDKQTDSYIKVYRKQFKSNDARHIYADQIVPGNAKSGDNWKGIRKRVLVDIDVPQTATTSDGENIWDEVRFLIKTMGITPITEYITPSGGLHIVLPDKEDKKYLYLKHLFQRFDDWKDKGRFSTVHPKEDGKIILYSNVQTKGY